MQLAAGDVPEARAWTDACLALTDTTRWVAFRPWPAAVLAETELADGLVTAATRASLDEAFALSCRLGDPCWEGATARMIALAHAADGELDVARSGSTRPCSAASTAPTTYAAVLAAILATAAELSAAAGDQDRTAHHARALIALAARAHLDHYLPQAVALLHRGRRPRTWVPGRPGSERSCRPRPPMGAPGAVGAWLRARGNPIWGSRGWPGHPRPTELSRLWARLQSSRQPSGTTERSLSSPRPTASGVPSTKARALHE